MFCKTLTFFEKISVTRNQCFPVYCQLQNENVAGKVEREDQCAKRKNSFSAALCGRLEIG